MRTATDWADQQGDQKAQCREVRMRQINRVSMCRKGLGCFKFGAFSPSPGLTATLSPGSGERARGEGEDRKCPKLFNTDLGLREHWLRAATFCLLLGCGR